MSGRSISYWVAILLFGLCTLSAKGQEFTEELCASKTPFCWVPVEEHKDCDTTCADNPSGPQNNPVDSGDYTGGDGSGVRFPHWVCRAKGDQGEGWRSGFNLKGWNDGTFIDTSCTFGAHGDEVSKQDFECLCSMPFPYLEEPDIIVGLGYGWIAAILAASTIGALLGVLCVFVFIKRAGAARYGLDTEISDLRHMKVPLTGGD